MVLDKPAYGDVTYWDARFEGEGQVEWLADLDRFSEYLLPYISIDSRILHIGCGTSRLSPVLYERGFREITNVDYSKVLLERMSKAYPEMKWICDDMRTLSKLNDQQFDVVIEKASIECLLVHEQSQWQLTNEASKQLDDVFASIHRVLKPGGYFISVSFTQPHFRIPHLIKNSYWNCEVDRFGDFFHYYVYRMKKGWSANINHLERYLAVTRSSSNENGKEHEFFEDLTSPIEIFANSTLDF